MSVSIKWLSYQSWFKITVNKTIIHIDPVIYKTYAGIEKELEEKADLILITHAHFDHCDPETIGKIIKTETIMIGAESCKEKFKSGLRVIKSGDIFEHNKIKVNAVPAYNIGKHFHPKGFGVGFILTIDNKTIYHAGDTDLIPEMEKLGNIDLALLPFGGTYTMDLQEAVKAVAVIKPKTVMPMHKLDSDPIKFKELVEKQTDSKVVVLKPGENYIIQ